MGINVCRIGDTGEGVCTVPHDPHTTTGTIITGAATVFAEESEVSRISDLIEADCSHAPIAVIITGSPTVFAEGSNVARIGDYFEGPNYSGTLLTGAATVFAE